MYKALLTFFALSVALGACKEKEDPQLKEAAAIHNEAHEIMESIEPQVNSIDSVQTALLEKKKTAKDTAAYTTVLTALGKVKADFKEWEENLVTVPGIEEHEHEEGEGHEHHHHHEHKKAPEVAPDQHLAIQKEIKKNIELIQSELKAAKQQAEALLK
ncbi:MAG: hypothetical protein QM669_09980 [Siphonobacter sp.]